LEKGGKFVGENTAQYQNIIEVKGGELKAGPLVKALEKRGMNGRLENSPAGGGGGLPQILPVLPLRGRPGPEGP